MGKKEERVLSACTLSWDISLRLLSIGWPAFLPPYLPLPCPPLSSLPASLPPPFSLLICILLVALVSIPLLLENAD